LNRFLLDTNVISEVRKLKPHGAVLEWLSGLASEQMFVSAVTLGELQSGIERTRRQDVKKAQEIEAWADLVAGSCTVLAMDAACFREWGRLREGSPERLADDAMIAATALVHNLTVATRNERDFHRFRVRVFNPFKVS
jgi:predicted nucleic acid-binding protein